MTVLQACPQESLHTAMPRFKGISFAHWHRGPGLPSGCLNLSRLLSVSREVGAGEQDVRSVIPGGKSTLELSTSNLSTGNLNIFLAKYQRSDAHNLNLITKEHETRTARNSLQNT